MRFSIRVSVLLTVFCSLFLGCRRDGEGVAVQKEWPAKGTDTVVEVSGGRLTVNDLEYFADIRLKMMGKALFQSKQDLVKARRRLIRSRYLSFPGTWLLVREAKRRGLRYQPADYERNRVRFANFPEKYKSTIDTLIDEDLSIGALRKDLLEQTPAPDDAFLKGRLNVIASRNARAQRTNEFSRTFLVDLKKRIQDGDIEFDEAARQYSEDEWVAESGSEWGSFALSELVEDVEVYDALRTMKPGDLAGPLHGDNGLMLLRLDAVSDDKYSLSRIFRRLMALFERETPDQMRRRFQNEECEEKFEALVRQLLRETPPSYPNGTNFIEKVLLQTTPKGKK